VTNKIGGGAFTPDDVRLLEAFCSEVVTVIARNALRAVHDNATSKGGADGARLNSMLGMFGGGDGGVRGGSGVLSPSHTPMGAAAGTPRSRLSRASRASMVARRKWGAEVEVDTPGTGGDAGGAGGGGAAGATMQVTTDVSSPSAGLPPMKPQTRVRRATMPGRSSGFGITMKDLAVEKERAVEEKKVTITALREEARVGVERAAAVAAEEEAAAEAAASARARTVLVPPACRPQVANAMLRWEWNVLEVEAAELELCAMDALFHFDLVGEVCGPPMVVARFISAIAARYRDNPYHNWAHAMSVLHVTFLSLRHSTALNTLFGGVEKAAVLLGALCHDVEHPGRNNVFQVSGMACCFVVKRGEDRGVGVCPPLVLSSSFPHPFPLPPSLPPIPLWHFATMTSLCWRTTTLQLCFRFSGWRPQQLVPP
jgi:hypothetical protein